MIVLFCSCQKKELFDEHCEDAPLSELSTVSIRFAPTDLTEVTTRADFETDITDLNVFIFCDKYGTRQNHFLISAGDLDLRLVNADYEVYVIANWGTDLGPKTKAEISGLQYHVSDQETLTSRGKMVMSGRQSFTLNGNTGITIPLIRVCAKANINVSLTPAMAVNSKIVYVHPVSLPGSAYLFADNKLNGVSPTMDFTLENLDSRNLTNFSKSYYFLENLQGKNATINSATGRTSANAPNNSSCIIVRIERNKKYIDYRIYFGENQTDDFNIRRNTCYNYNIVIEGENMTDYRVSTASIIFYAFLPAAGYGDYEHFDRLVWDSPDYYGQLDIITENNDRDNEYFVSFRIIQGSFQPGWFMKYMINQYTTYLPIIQNQSISIHKGNGRTIVYFHFCNNETVSLNAMFEFKVTDKYGFCKTFIVRATMSLNG